MGVTGHEWPGAESREHAVVFVYAGREIGAGADRRPHFHVGASEGKDARSPRCPTGLVDAFDQLGRDAEIASKRRFLIDRSLQLVLRAEGEAAEVIERQGRLSRARNPEPSLLADRG